MADLKPRAVPPRADTVQHPTSWADVIPGESSYSASGGTPTRTLAGVARRRRRTVAVVFVGVVLSVVIGTAFLPRKWESSTTILIEERARNSETPALEALELLGVGNQAETEIELMESRRVIEPVVDQLDLHARVETDDEEGPAQVHLANFSASPETSPGAYRIYRLTTGAYAVNTDDGVVVSSADAGSAVSFAGLTFDLPDESGPDEMLIRVQPFAAQVASVRTRLDARQVRRESGLVQLRCKASSPIEAQDLCDAVAGSYLRLRTELQRDEASATADFLGVQVAQVERRLRSAEDSLESFGRSHQVVALQERAAEEVRQLAGLQAEKEQLVAERTALHQLIRQVDESPGDQDRVRDLASFPTFLKNQVVAQLLSSLLVAEDDRARLAALRTEENADFMASAARVIELEGQLRDVATSYEQALANQIDAAESTLRSAGRRLSVIPTQQVQYARFQRQAALYDELYKFLEMRRREAEVAQAVELPSVRMVDQASLPYEPASPNPRRNIGLAMILGLAGGLGVGLVRDLGDHRVLERSELELQAGTPVLGLIPTVRSPGPLLVVRNDDAPRPHGGAIVIPSWDQQLALEAFRSLVADLRFLDRPGQRVKSVAVTSAGPGEGKTFVACNLALARALHSGRTMLVDADMRASRVSDFFGVAARPGLSEVLAGLADARAATTTMNVEDSGRLWLMPAGTPTLHSAALLEERLFERLISLVEKNVDLLIVDTPPLNVLADAATIASSVDAVLVVVRRGVTDREGLQLTLDRLSRTGVPSIHVVFNDVTLPKRYASYTYRYAPDASPNFDSMPPDIFAQTEGRNGQ